MVTMGSALRTALLYVLIAVLPIVAAAQVRVDVSPHSGALNDDFVFSVAIDSTEDSDPPTLTPSQDFAVSYIGPQSSVTIMNGKVQKKLMYSYRIRPRREGKLKSPGAEVNIGGRVIHVDPLEIVVSAAAPQPPPEKVAGVSLRQSIDPKSLYVGQQADTTLELQTALNLIEPQFVDLSYDGFWAETIVDNERSSRMMNGDQYDVLRFRKALYPLTSGSIVIPARRLKAQIRDRRRSRPFPFDHFDPFDVDIFDDFFGSGAFKAISVESNPLTVEVQELPFPPTGFKSWGLSAPIVGETTVQLNIAEGSMKVGESRTAEVVVISTGNLNPLKSIQINLPANLKSYPDAPESKNFESGGALMSRKIFRVSLVALAPGSARIPPLELGFFDPNEKAYRTANSQEASILVEGTPVSAATPFSEPLDAEQQSPALEQQRTPVPAGTYNNETSWERLSHRISWELALLLMIVVGGLLYVLRVLLRNRKGNAPLRVALQSIETAKSLEDLSYAFRNYLSLKLKMASPELRGESFRGLLIQACKDKDKLFALQAMLDDLDTFLYGRAQEKNLETLKEKARKLARSV